MNADGTLPVGANGVEESGFIRDWWIGLSMLHTLFAREHNAICDELKRHHPDWDDNRLFNVARLINAAVMAKIHSVEWTPAVLPNPALADALNANWYGVLTNLLRRGPEKKTLAPINVRNPEMGGVVGNPINKHGQPYGLTEEFVEVYRLHSLLPETLSIRRLGSDAYAGGRAFPGQPAGGLGETEQVGYRWQTCSSRSATNTRDSWCWETTRGSCKSSVFPATRFSIWRRWISCAPANEESHATTSSGASWA